MARAGGDPFGNDYYWDLYNQGLDPLTGMPRGASAPPPPGGGAPPDYGVSVGTPPPGGGGPQNTAPPPPGGMEGGGGNPPPGGGPIPGGLGAAYNALSAIDPNVLWAYEQNQVNNGVRFGHDEYDTLMRYLPQRISSRIGQPGGYSLGAALNRYLTWLRSQGYGS